MTRSHELGEAILVFPSLDATPPSGATAVRRWLERALASIRKWRELSRTRFDLSQLDERQLKDIGLTHSQALIESGKFFWQR